MSGLLFDRIIEHGLADYAALITSLACPCVRLIRTPIVKSALASGRSRLGGLPDLPPGHPWPIGQVYPMALIAQVRLSDVGAADESGLLPRSGTLSFWYDVAWQPWGFDPRDGAGFKVDFVAEDVSKLEARKCPPAPLKAAAPDYDRPANGSYPPFALQFKRGITLPNGEWIQEFAPRAAVLDELEAYAELLNSLCPDDDPTHQMLGHADLIQGPMEEGCQLASNGINCGGAHHLHGARIEQLRTGATDWRLLLQIDTDEDGPGWMWGDVGMIYYWIREQDFRRSDFSKVWIALQCG